MVGYFVMPRYIPYKAINMPGVGDYDLKRNKPPKGGRLYYEGNQRNSIAVEWMRPTLVVI